jgi:hypothetical protein
MRMTLCSAAGIVGALAVSAALSGCSTHRTYLADGSRGYSITCRGFLNTWDSCLVKAGQVCGPHGYTTIRSSEFDRALLISCKAPPKP